MGEEQAEYDIIQIPKGIKIEDLPKALKIDEPFQISDATYIITRTAREGLRVCKEEEEYTGEISDCVNFYVIKRI